MQPAELTKYINNPHLLNEQSVGRLQKLVDDFPYFQSAHILLSLASKKWDASVYQQSLRKTAIVVSNRSHLFKLIHQLDDAVVAEPETSIAPEPPQEQTPTANVEAEAPKAAIQSPEDTKHELDILKAAELSIEEKQAVPLPVQEIEKPAAVDPDAKVNEQIEKEMGKQLLSAFVEKEVLNTPDLHNPVKNEETPVSFNNWITYLKNRNQDASTAAKPLTTKVETSAKQEPKALPKEEKNPLDERKQKNRALIDRIIESSPGLIRVKEEQKFFTPDTKARESLQDNEHLVTETLARIYALQGNVNKAVRAYEILSLKFPQKSAYFATLIQKLKNQ